MNADYVIPWFCVNAVIFQDGTAQEHYKELIMNDKSKLFGQHFVSRSLKGLPSFGYSKAQTVAQT
jgi:hypothetical protein